MTSNMWLVFALLSALYGIVGIALSDDVLANLRDALDEYCCNRCRYERADGGCKNNQRRGWNK